MKQYSINDIAKFLKIGVQGVRDRIKKRNIKSVDWDTKRRCRLYTEKQVEQIKNDLPLGRPKKKIDN